MMDSGIRKHVPRNILNPVRGKEAAIIMFRIVENPEKMKTEDNPRLLKVIIINGPMGVGKTTAGKCIADRFPGTALIDGDWCMDIHPFVGSQETRAMAVDNILHMIGNYQKCSVCRMVVLVWLMDDPWVIRKITEGIAASGAEARIVTLVCSRENLTARWKNDRSCEWRTDEWLNVSIRSLPFFASMDHAINTDSLSAEQVADLILQQCTQT